MNFLIKAFALLSYAEGVPSHPTTREHVAVIVDDLLDDQHHGYRNEHRVTVSPQCWNSAVRLLTEQQHSTGMYYSDNSAAELCARLSEAHQKRLALEIAHCHMEDLGTPLYTSMSVERTCSGPTMDLETVKMCLKHLTSAGATSYTHYITYVQVLCTRKTQELFLKYQEGVKNEISTKYAAISSRSIEHMEAIHELSKKHGEQLNALSEIPQLVKEKMTEEMKTHMKAVMEQTLDEQFKGRLDTLLQEQSSEQAHYFGSIMDSLELRDAQDRERHESWTHYQSSLLLQQSREMERQRKTLQEHRNNVEGLAQIVSLTSSNLQPLIGLQSLVHVATEGYSWITFLLYFLLTFNVVWVVTRYDRCRTFRAHMFAMVLAEAVFELALSGAVKYDVLTDSDRTEYTTQVRRVALFVECASYVVGMIVSTFVSSDQQDGSVVTKGELDRLLHARFDLNTCQEQRDPRQIVQPYRQTNSTRQRGQRKSYTENNEAWGGPLYAVVSPHEERRCIESTPYRSVVDENQGYRRPNSSSHEVVGPSNAHARDTITTAGDLIPSQDNIDADQFPRMPTSYNSAVNTDSITQQAMSSAPTPSNLVIGTLVGCDLGLDEKDDQNRQSLRPTVSSMVHKRLATESPGDEPSTKKATVCHHH